MAFRKKKNERIFLFFHSLFACHGFDSFIFTSGRWMFSVQYISNTGEKQNKTRSIVNTNNGWINGFSQTYYELYYIRLTNSTTIYRCFYFHLYRSATKFTLIVFNSLKRSSNRGKILRPLVCIIILVCDLSSKYFLRNCKLSILCYTIDDGKPSCNM